MKKFILTAAVLALGMTPAFANEITATFIGGGSGPGGIYSPYQADVLTGKSALPITIYCVDYPDHVSPGEVWTANITSVNSADLSATYFSGLGSDIYQQLAYLANIVHQQSLAVQSDIANSVDSSADQEKLEAAQNAMWQLTSPGDFSVPGYMLNGMSQYVPTADVQADLNLAVANAGPASGEDWYVLSGTNTGAGRVQEFLFHTEDVHGYEAPEPATAWVGGGLLAAMALIAKRRGRPATV